MDFRLHASTGDDLADEVVRRFVGDLETELPERIRACYLGGSYSDRTARGHDRSPNSSDLDLFVIFRGTLAPGEDDIFHRLVVASRQVGPVALDAHAYPEEGLSQMPDAKSSQLNFLNVLIRTNGVLLYGEDVRSLLSEISCAGYLLDVIESAVFHLGIPRQTISLAYPLETPLTTPLDYPDPYGEFHGYDAVPVRPEASRGTRVLVSIATWIATLILALETGHYATQKSQAIQLCQEYLPNDERVQLAKAIYDACKGQLAYGLPRSCEGIQRLRALCHDLLGLENEYLDLCKSVMLGQLRGGGAGEKRQAVSILQSVRYHDGEITSALRELLVDADTVVRAAARNAVEFAEQGS